MKTFEKREHFIKTASKELNRINKLIENGEYRQLDSIVNTWNDPVCISYVITLLCDELIVKDRELNGELMEEY